MNKVDYFHKIPIWRDSNRLLVEVEKKVRGFPRYHKYTIGTELRKSSINVCRFLVRAYKETEKKSKWVEKLNTEIEDLKVLLYVAKEIKAFNNFNDFKEITDITMSIGKQSGRWLKNLNSISNQEI